MFILVYLAYRYSPMTQLPPLQPTYEMMNLNYD